MKNIFKYCLAFLFFLSLVFTSNTSLASIKKDIEITIKSTSFKSETTIEKEKQEIKILDNLFRV